MAWATPQIRLGYHHWCQQQHSPKNHISYPRNAQRQGAIANQQCSLPLLYANRTWSPPTTHRACFRGTTHQCEQLPKCANGNYPPNIFVISIDSYCFVNIGIRLFFQLFISLSNKQNATVLRSVVNFSKWKELTGISSKFIGILNSI